MLDTYDPRSVAQAGPLCPPAAMLRYLGLSDPLRARAEAAVAALEALAARILDQLDALEPDPDLEDGGDTEPQGDDEPTMGATAVSDQRLWCEDIASTRYPIPDQPARAADECELVCEDEGAQCDDEGHDTDREQDDSDREPDDFHLCGWCSGDVDQTRPGGLPRGTYFDRGERRA